MQGFRRRGRDLNPRPKLFTGFTRFPVLRTRFGLLRRSWVFPANALFPRLCVSCPFRPVCVANVSQKCRTVVGRDDATEGGSGRSSGSRCTYVSSVKAGEWWPSHACTCLTLPPSRKSAVAHVCRKPWKPSHATSAAIAAALKSSARCPACSHEPVELEKTSSLSAACVCLRCSHSRRASSGESRSRRRPYADFGGVTVPRKYDRSTRSVRAPRSTSPHLSRRSSSRRQSPSGSEGGRGGGAGPGLPMPAVNR
jgi:hypothetical protein